MPLALCFVFNIGVGRKLVAFRGLESSHSAGILALAIPGELHPSASGQREENESVICVSFFVFCLLSFAIGRGELPY